MNFLEISNADGKVWQIPTDNVRTGLQLYQPSSFKGKMLKKLLPWLHRWNLVRRKLGIRHVPYSPDPELIEIAEKAFNVKDPEYSVFGGTPSVHQKTTIQFFKGRKILGYGKVSANEDIIQLFRHEESLLDFLHSRGIRELPECLYCGKIKDGSGFFLQSTVKDSHSYSPAKWGRHHEEFLQQMYEKTRREVKFEDSDFYESLAGLQEILPKLPEEFRDAIKRNIDKVMNEFAGKTVDFCAFHADFTPWNMFIKGERLFVFDWEYGRETYPPFLDKYHFHIQQMIHVEHLDRGAIMARLRKEEWFDEKVLRWYVLDLLSRFAGREKGETIGAGKIPAQIWLL